MIELKDYVIDSANLGSENPLPDIKNVSYIHAGYNTTEKVTADDSKYFGKGMINTILPYKLQDGYDRDRKPKTYRAAVLENEYLKAIFLPELGGRMWSLFDKVGDRELLYKNPVFQPANLALRNAWFSGGIEFNVSVKGHNFLTCSPIFADVIDLENGEQVLHMYEFERVREIVYSIVAYLPKGSKYLYLKEMVENRSEKEKFVYWWSNIAVPETADTRIIVPTDESFLSSYNEGSYVVDKIQIPEYNGKDISYPYNSHRSQDYFYKIPDANAKWIAAINGDGNGLLQFSDHKMIGRKLFVWGMGAGGRHWGEWLSEPGQSYIEIQAGIARTQLEHLPLMPNEVISWTECYGAVNCDKDAIHKKGWKSAQQEVEKNSIFNLNAAKIEEHLQNVFPKIDFTKSHSLVVGSGWGALENRKRAVEGKPSVSGYFNFSEDSIGNEQKEWLDLLEEGHFNGILPENEPLSYVSNEFWVPYLKKAAEIQNDSQWYALYQLGVLKYILNDIDESLKLFLKSAQVTENAWSYRNIAMLYHKELGNPEKAIEYIMKAAALQPNCKAILINAAEILTKYRCFEEWLSVYAGLSENLVMSGRLRLYKGLALIELGRLDEAKEIVNEHFVMSDIQEGELSISYLWGALYRKIISDETGITDSFTLEKLQNERYPLPKSLDYRMHA